MRTRASEYSDSELAEAEAGVDEEDGEEEAVVAAVADVHHASHRGIVDGMLIDCYLFPIRPIFVHVCGLHMY